MAQGETVEVVYKSSKLARAVRRHALLVPPESIVESDAGLMAELEKTWKRDDRKLGKNAL
jgi:hypothetical protein